MLTLHSDGPTMVPAPVPADFRPLTLIRHPHGKALALVGLLAIAMLMLVVRLLALTAANALPGSPYAEVELHNGLVSAEKLSIVGSVVLALLAFAAGVMLRTLDTWREEQRARQSASATLIAEASAVDVITPLREAVRDRDLLIMALHEALEDRDERLAKLAQSADRAARQLARSGEAMAPLAAIADTVAAEDQELQHALETLGRAERASVETRGRLATMASRAESDDVEVQEVFGTVHELMSVLEHQGAELASASRLLGWSRARHEASAGQIMQIAPQLASLAVQMERLQALAKLALGDSSSDDDPSVGLALHRATTEEYPAPERLAIVR